MATWVKFTADTDERKNGVWWLLYDIRRGLKTTKQFERDCNWEILYHFNIEIQGSLVDSKRIPIFMNSLERGDILSPITINAEDNILDGAHKHRAFHKLHSTIIPLMRPAKGKGGKIIKDEVYAPLIKGFKHFKRPLMLCLRCTTEMEKLPDVFICRKCQHQTSNINVLGWGVI